MVIQNFVRSIPIGLGTRLPVIARRSRELVLAGQELVAAAKLYLRIQTNFANGKELKLGREPGNGDFCISLFECVSISFLSVWTGNIRGEGGWFI
jgi:hypothetical protein